MRNFRKVERTSFWIPETVGDDIEGAVMAVGGIVTTVNGEMEFISIKTVEGTKAIGVSAGLRNLLEQVEVGNYIRVVFKGEEINKKTGRRFKAFELFIAE